MFYKLSHIIQALVLFLNAITILNEKRVLRPLGLNVQQSYLDTAPGPKQRLLNFIIHIQNVMKCLCKLYNPLLSPYLFISISFIFHSILYRSANTD